MDKYMVMSIRLTSPALLQHILNTQAEEGYSLVAILPVDEETAEYWLVFGPEPAITYHTTNNTVDLTDTMAKMKAYVQENELLHSR